MTLLVVYDKSKADLEMAGLIGYLNTSEKDMATEIGPVIIFKRFHRSHVASNATGLLLHYALDLPKDGGLGFRRVAWSTGDKNEVSVRFAQKMGFQNEGLLRWTKTLLPEKMTGSNGKQVRDGDPRADLGGRNTTILSVCWDDWENGGRELCDSVMDRIK
jgi:RimJ/RimL family protein N-acetyltransferase